MINVIYITVAVVLHRIILTNMGTAEFTAVNDSEFVGQFFLDIGDECK